MFESVDIVSAGYWSNWANRLIVDSALAYFVTFIYVFLRISGLMIVGPFFAHASIPQQVKVLFALSLALIVTPSIQEVRQRGFDNLDRNKDGVLVEEEVPRLLREPQITTEASERALVQTTITRGEFLRAQAVPSTLFDLVWIGAMELLIGMILGLGVVIILVALQMAGESFDQQAGTALSEIFNPALGTTISPSGQLFFMLGTVALLTMPPFDGHLMMLMTLMRTFEVIPLGMTWADAASFDVLRGLMTQSLALAVQVAAPLLATMALLSVAMGFLGYTVPQINVLVLGFPIRAMLSAAILTVSLTGAAHEIVERFPSVLESLFKSFLTG